MSDYTTVPPEGYNTPRTHRDMGWVLSRLATDWYSHSESTYEYLAATLLRLVNVAYCRVSRDRYTDALMFGVRIGQAAEAFMDARGRDGRREREAVSIYARAHYLRAHYSEAEFFLIESAFADITAVPGTVGWREVSALESRLVAEGVKREDAHAVLSACVDAGLVLRQWPPSVAFLSVGEYLEVREELGLDMV